jgi:hypothetical protein
MWVGTARRARFCGPDWPMHTRFTPECQAYSHEYPLPGGCSCPGPVGERGHPFSTDPSCFDYCTLWAKVYGEYERLCFDAPGSKHYNDPRCTVLEDQVFHLDGRRLTACGCESMPRDPSPPSRNRSSDR